MLTLKELQTQQLAWARHNFGQAPSYHLLLGMIEEVGELSHSLLKSIQNIRGSAEKHDLAGKDAVADVTIYMTQYCSERSLDLQEVLGVETFEAVQAIASTIESSQVQENQKVPPTAKMIFFAIGAMAHIAEYESAPIGADSGYDSAGAISAILSVLGAYCAFKGWSLQQIVEEVWTEVSKRDWKLYPKTGLPPVQEPVVVESVQ